MSAVTIGSLGLVPSITIGGIEHDILHHGGALSVRVGTLGGGHGNIIAAGGVTAASTGVIVFSNSNNVSFGLVGRTVTATAGYPDAALSDHDHGGIAIVSGLIGGTIGSDGWSLSIPDFLTTAALSDHSHSNYVGLNTSTVTIAGTNVTLSANTNGLTFGIPKFLTTAAEVSHIHGNMTTASTAGSDIKYTSASSGLTLGVPKFLTTYGGGEDLTLGGNTSGTLVLMNSGTVTIAGGNNITLSQAGNAFTISGANQSTHDHPFIASESTSVFQYGSDSTLFQLTSDNSLSLATDYTSHTHSYISGYTETQTAISGIAAQGSTFTSGTVHFSAQSNITIQTYLDGVSQYVRLSVPDFAGTTTAGTNVGLTVNSLGIRASIDTAGMSMLGDGANFIAAGSQTAGSLATVSFNNAGGVSFGMSDNSIVTASYTQSTHDHPYLNTSNSSLLQHTSATSAITSNALNTSQSSLFQLTADNSLSLDTGYTTHTHDYQSTGDYLTTAALSNHSHGNPTLALTNLSGTTASASNGFTLSLSGPDVGGAQTGISGIGVSNTTYTSGTVIWSAQNNITIGSSVNGASQYVRLSVADAMGTDYTSHTHDYQSTGNYLTTQLNQAASASNGSFSFETLSMGSAGVTFYTNASGIQGSYSQSTHEHPYINTSDSTVFLNTEYTTHDHSQYMNTSERDNYYYTSTIVDASFSNLSLGGNSIFLGNDTDTDVYYLRGLNDKPFVFGGLPFGTVSDIDNNTYQDGGFQYANQLLSGDVGIYGGYVTGSSAKAQDIALVAGRAEGLSVYGGSIHINAGDAWNTLASGGDVSLAGGMAYGSNGSGGNIILRPGGGSTISGGTDGCIIFANTLDDGIYFNLGNITNDNSLYFPINSGTLALEGDFINTSDGTVFLDTGYTTHTHTYADTAHSHTQYIGLLTTNVTGADATIDNSKFQLDIPQGSLYYIDGNGVSFTASSSSYSTSIYASVNAAASDHTHVYAGTSFSTVSTGGTALLGSMNTAGMSLSVPAWITTAAGGGIAIGASNTTYTSGTVVFSADANITIGTTETNGIQYIKLSANISGDTAGDGVNIIAAGTQTANSTGTVVFSNSNGVSFGMSNNSIITASYTQSTHEHPYLNTSQSSLLQHTSATSAITSNALNTSQSSLLQHTSATSAITSNALNTSVSGSFQLTADNSLSLGTAYTTHTHLYQSTGNYLTTAAQSNQVVNSFNGSTGQISLATGSSLSSSQNGSSITLGLASNISTAWSANASRVIQINGSSGSISLATGSSLSSSANASGITFGLASNITTALQSAGAYLTTAMQSVCTSAFQFSSNTSAITASAMNTSERSSYISRWSLVGVNTAGTTTRGVSDNILYLSGDNMITLSGDVGTIKFSVNTESLLGTAYTTHSHGAVSLSLSNISGTYSSASNGLTLSLTGVPTGGDGGVGNVIAAGSQTANTSGTVLFSNSNGISFGMSNNSIITANYTQSTHEHSTLTFAGSNHTHNFLGLDSTGVTGAEWTVNTSQFSLNIPQGTLYFSDSNGISWGSSVSSLSTTITANFTGTSGFANATHTHGSVSLSLSNISGTYSSASNGLTLSLTGATGGGVGDTGMIYYLDANEITWGSSTAGSTTSISADYAAAKNIIISGNTSGTTATVSSGTMVLIGGNNITLSQNSNSIAIVGGAGAGGGAALQGSGTYTQNSGTIKFETGNGLTFGLTNNLMTASHNAYSASSQLTGTFLTTAALSNHSHGNISFGTRTGTVYSYSSASNGLTISAPNALTTAALSNHTHTDYINASDTGSVYFTNSYNVSWSSSNTSNSSYIWASASGVGGGGGVAIAASNTTYTSGTVQFRGTNLTVNTSAGGQYVDLLGPSAGNVYFSDSNNVSFGSSVDGVSTTITATAAGGAGGAALQGSGTYTQNSGTIKFETGNGLTFGLSNNGVMTASHNAYSASSQLTGTFLQLASSSRFAGINTSSSSTAGANLAFSLNSSGATFSVPAWLTTQSAQAFSASGGSSAFQTLNFADSNGITFSNTNASLRITHALQYTSNTSNITANAINTSVSSRFAGTGASTAGAVSATLNTNGLSISVPAVGYLSFINSNGYTWSTSVNGVSTGIWLVLA